MGRESGSKRDRGAQQSKVDNANVGEIDRTELDKRAGWRCREKGRKGVGEMVEKVV